MSVTINTTHIADAGDCPRLTENARLHRENLELRQQAAYWKALHQRAVEREETLKLRLQELEAQIKQLNQQQFGRKSEKSKTNTSSASSSSSSPSVSPKRPRGHQKGQKGHRRRNYSHLPVQEDIRDVPLDDRLCDVCGQPFVDLGQTEDSEQIEINVRAHRRVIKRKKYVRACQCPGHDQRPVVTAAPAPKLIPKSRLGVSVWVMILLDKFQSMRPTTRLLAQWRLLGLDLSLGTVTNGLQTLAPLFAPIYEALVERSRTAGHWHADETRWQVFAEVEGKIGQRWYLWVFASADAVVYVLDPSRSTCAPAEHFGIQAEGILSVDRYAVYKSIAGKVVGLILAFCWAHVRRDFLGVATSWPDQKDWAVSWVEAIARLYDGNDRRRAVRQQPKLFAERDQELRAALAAMKLRRETELVAETLHPARRKVLSSLAEHWEGLTVFADHPEVPMDNNTAERLLRQPVVGRKNFYGSGAEWSGYFLATMLSILQTLTRWNINLHAWLTDYLNACAENDGQAPKDVTAFLPWNFKPTQPVPTAEPKQPQPANST